MSPRTINRYGIVSDAPPMKFHKNPVPMICDQCDQLGKLLDEYRFEMKRIGSDENLTAAGKLQKLSPITEKMKERLGNLKKDPRFRVHGIEATQKELAIPQPSTGNESVDFLRRREIRDRLQGMDKVNRLEMVLNSDNPELLFAVLESPIPFPDVSKKDVEGILARMGEKLAPEAADRLYDLNAIQETISVNWQSAENYLQDSLARF